MGDRTRIPKLVEGVDIRKLPIGPEEAFLLSRVDGHSGPGDLAIGTGFDDSRVIDLLDKLQTLGAIAYAEPGRPKAPVAMRTATPQPSSTPQAQADLEANSIGALDQVLKRLETADHYQALGLSRDAQKAEVKAAYFGIIGRYHPDRYFGANLGDAKARLQRIVARLTDAYDTLSRSELRTAYDATLPAPSGVARPAQPEPSVPPIPSPRVAHASAVTPSPSVDPAARQRALARMLSGSSMTALRRPSVSMDMVDGPRSVASFRASSVSPAVTTTGAPGPAPMTVAGSAEPTTNALGTVNALKLALAKTPNDPDLQRRLRDAERIADSEMRDRLKIQAKQANDAGRPRDAMLLYERAARATQSADLYLEAARCSIAANESPRRSAGFAKSGLELAPDHAALHSLLGRIYAEAGMTNSAVSALEKARSLDPSDETVKALLERVKNA